MNLAVLSNSLELDKTGLQDWIQVKSQTFCLVKENNDFSMTATRKSKSN